MARRSSSLFRQQFEDALQSIRLDGSILDLGGSRKSGYQQRLLGAHEFTVVNIDDAYGYDLKFDVERPFPLADASYDHALCINLLEHVYDYAHVLHETKRVLRPDGMLVTVTPYSVPLHPCPHDYFRYSGEALHRMLTEAGFAVERVDALGDGLFSALYQQGMWIFPGPLRTLARICAVALDRTLRRLSARYRAVSARYVLGYVTVSRSRA